MENQIKNRRYEFDWLRVLAFGLLIFYHTGMFFVSWDWHIKNNELSQTMELPMRFLSQWRMSLIFLVSGAGVYFALGYRSAHTFAKDRLKRIFLPLVVGTLVVVPPQVYFERLAQGFSGSYIEFYPSIFSTGPYPSGNFSWHHLWYLAYIFVYSLLFLPLLLRLRSGGMNFAVVRKWQLLLIPAIWLSLGGMLYINFPGTNDLIHDWGNHFLYCSIFLFGFLLISSVALQQKIKEMRWLSLMLATLTITALYIHFWLPDKDMEEGSGLYVYIALIGANRWLWLMTILGFAMQYLNYKWKHLPLANEMVYPFYILHQTVIVALGFYFRNIPWSVGLKFSLIVAATFIICFVLVRLVLMRVNWLRVPFGLKPRHKAAPVAAKQVTLQKAPSGAAI